MLILFSPQKTHTLEQEILSSSCHKHTQSVNTRHSIPPLAINLLKCRLYRLHTDHEGKVSRYVNEKITKATITWTWEWSTCNYSIWLANSNNNSTKCTLGYSMVEIGSGTIISRLPGHTPKDGYHATSQQQLPINPARRREGGESAWRWSCIVSWNHTKNSQWSR